MDYDLISYLEYNLYAFSLVEITIANETIPFYESNYQKQWAPSIEFHLD